MLSDSLQPSLRVQCGAFMLGSFFFALGSAPYMAVWVGPTLANTLFFTGAWFFTCAAFIQLALSGPPTNGPAALRAIRLVWLSAAVQLLGTILFNISTGAAVQVSTVTGQRKLVWGPNADGSAAFLISSVLAVLVLARAGRLGVPRDRSTWSTWVNLAGSIAFGASAVAAIVQPSGAQRDATLASVMTFVGALCFFTAAALLLPGQGSARSADGVPRKGSRP